MAVGNQAQQRAKLRRAVGHQADTALVSDDLLDDALENALLEVNRQWPLQSISSFETVADQQTYSILPAGAYRVLQVYWPLTCNSSDADSWWNGFQREVNMLLTEVDELGTRYPVEPALAAAYYRYRTWLDRFQTGGVSISPPDTVRLMPVPGSSGDDVYFLYSTPRFATIEDVAEAQERPYWAYAQFYLHNVLATGRGALQEVRSPLGVQMRTRASMAHKEAAQLWERRFQGMLPALRSSRNSP